jgi:hypothetical protein
VLYRPEAFESLTGEAWNEERVREAIREIVADADAAFDPEGLWPAHEWDVWRSALPLENLYVGAAGVLHALDVLRRRGHAETRIDLAAASLRALAAWRGEPNLWTGVELPAHPEAALLTGETGILTVAWRHAPSADLADDLFARARENIDEANELMWGTPGTMIAARALLDWTGEQRWADVWRESADALWSRREPDGLWTQRLYGEVDRGLGPPHGLVGNVRALLAGSDLLGADRRDALRRDAAHVLGRTAVVEDGCANWPMAEGGDLVAGDGEIRLQWCYGAPGVVISSADYLDEELLVAGASLVWRAGPPGMEKGPCICHGTAAGGYAFLKVFKRTGDEVWLERARRFAVHSLEQVRRGRAERGRGRYSLWTGDIGVALYAADCLDRRTAYPVVDTWD